MALRWEPDAAGQDGARGKLEVKVGDGETEAAAINSKDLFPKMFPTEYAKLLERPCRAAGSELAPAAGTRVVRSPESRARRRLCPSSA